MVLSLALYRDDGEIIDGLSRRRIAEWRFLCYRAA